MSGGSRRKAVGADLMATCWHLYYVMSCHIEVVVLVEVVVVVMVIMVEELTHT